MGIPLAAAGAIALAAGWWRSPAPEAADAAPVRAASVDAADLRPSRDVDRAVDDAAALGGPAAAQRIDELAARYRSDPDEFARARDLLLTAEDDKAHQILLESLVRSTEDADDETAAGQRRLALTADLVDQYFERPTDEDRKRIRNGLERVAGDDAMAALERHELSNAKEVQRERNAVEKAIDWAKGLGQLPEGESVDELRGRALE